MNMLLLFVQRLEKEENIKKSIENHRFHISKLEALMRAVDNDALDIEKVASTIHKRIIIFVTVISSFSFECFR